jgi:type IV secretory pathway TrbF-like protein
MLQARVLARKRMDAALFIQRCYRHWQSRVGAQSRSAQVGAALVCDSMSVLRVSFLITALYVSKRTRLIVCIYRLNGGSPCVRLHVCAAREFLIKHNMFER